MKRFLLLSILLLETSALYGGGFPSLKLGADARSGGMGMAFTALSGDGAAAYWNPAGLTRLERKDVQLAIHRWVEGVHSEFLSFGWGNGAWGFGLHALYTEVGDIEYRVVPSPTPLTTFSANELVLGFSLARTLSERIGFGVTVKMLYEKIFVDEAWGVAADIGLQWELVEDGLRAGGVIQNVGWTGTLDEEAIELPFLWKFGVAFPLSAGEHRLVAVLDVIQERGFPVHVHCGFEAGYKGFLFLRGGYQTGYDIRSFTGGVGISWKAYRLDYGYMPIDGGFGDSHRLSVGIGW